MSVELVAMVAEVGVLQPGTGAAVKARAGFLDGVPGKDSEADHGRAAGA